VGVGRPEVVALRRKAEEGAPALDDGGTAVLRRPAGPRSQIDAPSSDVRRPPEGPAACAPMRGPPVGSRTRVGGERCR
jgi:hypothetical protein